jgi:hypothetical protein
MSEQDRYEGHFSVPGTKPHINLNALNRGPGAEQDVHGSHFSIKPGFFGKKNASEFVKGTSASEQDRYVPHFSLVPLPITFGELC